MGNNWNTHVFQIYSNVSWKTKTLELKLQFVSIYFAEVMCCYSLVLKYNLMVKNWHYTKFFWLFHQFYTYSEAHIMCDAVRRPAPPPRVSCSSTSWTPSRSPAGAPCRTPGAPPTASSTRSSLKWTAWEPRRTSSSSVY